MTDKVLCIWFGDTCLLPLDLLRSMCLQVLQKAVCPEKRIGLDSAVSALASVTEVEVSGDLTIAKVYLSIFSDDEGKNIAISGLKRLQGYVRKHIATSMNLRMAPEVRFYQDDTIERAEQVISTSCRMLDSHFFMSAQ